MKDHYADDAAHLMASLIRGVLEATGARPVEDVRMGPGPLEGIYEDPASVIGFAVYKTVEEMASSWLDAQEQLARTLSSPLYDMRDKVWDGYLVLGTPEQSRTSLASDLAKIRANTKRVRKLIITGEETLTLSTSDFEAMRSAVSRGLSPLLPLSLDGRQGASDPLAGLSERVQAPGVAPQLIDAVVEAYRDGRPLLQTLHTRGVS